MLWLFWTRQWEVRDDEYASAKFDFPDEVKTAKFDDADINPDINQLGQQLVTNCELYKKCVDQNHSAIEEFTESSLHNHIFCSGIRNAMHDIESLLENPERHPFHPFLTVLDQQIVHYMDVSIKSYRLADEAKDQHIKKGYNEAGLDAGLTRMQIIGQREWVEENFDRKLPNTTREAKFNLVQ